MANALGLEPKITVIPDKDTVYGLDNLFRENRLKPISQIRAMECARSDCQRRTQQSVHFRPILSHHTGTRRNKSMPVDSQVGWCSPCWNRKRSVKSVMSTLPYLLLLQAQIVVWARDFNIEYFQVNLGDVTFAMVTLDKATELFYHIRSSCTEKGVVLADNFRIRPFGSFKS